MIQHKCITSFKLANKIIKIGESIIILDFDKGDYLHINDKREINKHLNVYYAPMLSIKEHCKEVKINTTNHNPYK